MDLNRIEKLLQRARAQVPAPAIVICLDAEGNERRCSVDEMIKNGWEWRRMISGGPKDAARVIEYYTQGVGCIS